MREEMRRACCIKKSLGKDLLVNKKFPSYASSSFFYTSDSVELQNSKERCGAINLLDVANFVSWDPILRTESIVAAVKMVFCSKAS